MLDGFFSIILANLKGISVLRPEVELSEPLFSGSTTPKWHQSAGFQGLHP
jgi:hypothetical protein